MAVNLHTTQYRFGIDELAESTHGWYAAQNTNPTANAINPGKTFLLRFNVQETGGTAAGNTDFQFRVALNGGSFQDITTSSTIVKAVDPAAWADAANCTQRVAGTGTFESSGAGCTIDGLSGGATNDIAASGCSETECGLQIVAADVKAGDTITFALTSPDFTITNDVVPTLTLTAPPEGARESSLPAASARSFPQNRNQNILSWALNLLQSTLAPVAEVATQLRGALLSNPIWRQWRPESVFAVGLLLTTLAAVNPIVNQVWANPTAPIRSRDLITWTRGPLPSSIVNQYNLGPYDWPNPSLGPVRPIGSRTWVQGPNPGSIPNTTLPPFNYDWKNPRQPGRIVNLLTWVGRVAGPPAAPAVEDLPPGKSVQDLPPWRPKRSQKLLTWLQVPGQDFGPPPPSIQYDWPVPRGPIRRAGYIDFLSLPRITPPPTFPQGDETEWIVPKAPARPLRNLTWLQGPRELFPQSPLFPEVIPNPRGVTRPQPPTWIHSAPLTLGIPLQSAAIPAGTQYDFPNPKRPARSINLLTFVGRVAGEPAAAVTTLPDGKSTEWIVPRAAPRAINLRVFAGRSLTEGPPPFFQTEWPNPKPQIKAPQPQLVGASLQVLTFTPPTPEPRLYDWPVPQTPRRGQGFTTSTPLPLFFPQPFNQTAWPNPTLQYRSIDLRTIAGSITALNFPPPEALPAGQISHTTDFPVPKGAPRSASLLAGFIDSNRTANPIPPPPPPGTGYYDIWHYYTGM